MGIEIRRNLKFRVLLAKSADILCAALCGNFVALGLLSLSVRDFGCRGSGDVVNTVAFAVFMLTTLFGIYGRPRLMPKVVFSLSLTVAVFLFPARFAGAFQILFYPLTMALLISGARWKGARFAALALTFVLAFGISLRRNPEVRGEKPPESLYLPASLTAEQPGGLMLVFGDSSADELLRYMNYRKGWAHLNLVIPRTVLNLFRRGTDKYKVIIAGRSARFGGTGIRKWVYRWLIDQLEPEGVLVMPIGETELLPPGDWRFSVMPGGNGRWVAARCGAPVCVDPEVLDERLIELSPSPDSRVLPAGAIPAMYLPAADRKVTPPPPESSGLSTCRRYILAALAAGWVLLRLLLCRKARIGTLAAALETSAAMMLYSLAMFSLFGKVMMDTGLTPVVLLAGIGILLFPRPHLTARGRIFIPAIAALGLLPWIPGLTWCWLPLFGWLSWFVSGAAVFTGLRYENRRAALTGAVLGAAAGGALFQAFGSGSAWFPLCAAVVLMIPSWLRR